MSSSDDRDFDILTTMIGDVKKMTEENTRAIRGHNGDSVGIDGRLIRVETIILRMEPVLNSLAAAVPLLTAAVQHIETRPCRFEGRIVGLEAAAASWKGKEVVSEDEIDEKIEEATDADHVMRTGDIREKIGWPLAVFMFFGVIALLVIHSIWPNLP